MSPCQVALRTDGDGPSCVALTPAAAGRDAGSAGLASRASFRVPGLARDLRVKIASEPQEFQQAFALLAENYRARGYEPEGEKPFRFTRYHALPGTATIVALDGERVCATVSLVPDSEVLGLPMEAIYGPEVAGLRAAGFRLAEWTSLADTGLSIREFVQVFKALIKLGFQYHASRGGDCWLITINPRHNSFYQKVLGFVPMGPQRAYPTVENHPAEAYLLTSKIMATRAPQMYQEVFGEVLPAALLMPPPWSQAHVRYFGARSSQLDPDALDDLLSAIASSRSV